MFEQGAIPIPDARFPIPMRGNELTRGISTRRISRKFPIPMRGNETGTIWGAGNATTTFPIPMRGNEHRQRVFLVLEIEFPIPMRGNEVEVSLTPVPRIYTGSRSP